MSASLPIALALSFLPQSDGPVPAGTQDADQGWSFVAALALQANDRVVSIREFDGVVQAEATRQGVARSEPRYEQIARDALREVAMTELEPQAGRELGLDPAQIDRVVRLNLQDKRREMGTAGLADVLAEGGQTYQTLSAAQAADTYRRVWRGTLLGWKGISSRPIRDVFIRPGELRAIYRSNREFLDPAVVELQIIQSPVRAYGGDEQAGLEYLNEARERALAGEDFTSLVEQYSAIGAETQGLHPPYVVSEITVPELREWAATARTGEVGPVLSVILGSERSLLLPRVVARRGGEIPSYEEPRVQQVLRETFDRERSTRILRAERNTLLGSAFTWVSPRLRFLLTASSPGDPAR